MTTPNGPSRLALGTAQFGTTYGIANRTGKVAPQAVARILDRAWLAGIDTLDTAPSYGDAEQVLGNAGVQGWRVVSKLPAVPDACADVATWVECAVQRSLESLRVSQLDGLLLHLPDQLRSPRGDELHAALVRIRDLGMVRRIGASVYGPDQLGQLWPRFAFDMVQAPMNAFDQRLRVSGMLQRLVAAGVDVDIRSVFLQGLLLADAHERPAAFERFNKVWARWDEWRRAAGVSALHAALAIALATPGISRCVVGVDDLSQLEQVIRAASASVIAEAPDFGEVDDALIDPRRWGAN